MPSPLERRLHPRFIHTLPLKLHMGGCDIATETKNISASGAYCFVDRLIKPMTKLAINMELPVVQKDKNTSLKIRCQGIVVRAEEALPLGYNIAIFFNSISDTDKHKIAQYISQHITV